jgi:hypothetical protein
MNTAACSYWGYDPIPAGAMSQMHTSTSQTGITGTNSTGSGSGHSILQPYITLNYCIKYSDVRVVMHEGRVAFDARED